MTEWPFLTWSPDDAAAAVYDVTVPGAWEQLVEFYADGAPSAPLERIVALAREHGARSLVVEQRHLDADWRSAHGAFHGRLFRRHPSATHRWHPRNTCGAHTRRCGWSCGTPTSPTACPGAPPLDSTASTHHEPLLSGLIALHGGRIAHRIGPDHGQRREVRIDAPRHYVTGRRSPS